MSPEEWLDSSIGRFSGRNLGARETIDYVMHVSLERQNVKILRGAEVYAPQRLHAGNRNDVFIVAGQAVDHKPILVLNGDDPLFWNYSEGVDQDGSFFTPWSTQNALKGNCRPPANYLHMAQFEYMD